MLNYFLLTLTLTGYNLSYYNCYFHYAVAQINLEGVFHMELSTKLAQVIVDRMMKTIPYNINMMNDEGIIIASGDHTRIGKLHTEAIRVLKKNEILKFSHNDPKENVQPGVNIPVNFHDQTIGVIGITGDPQEVTPFALLLKSSTELLLEQQSFQQIEENKQNKLTRFLFRWTQKDIDFDTTQNLEKEALELNIDFYFERTVVIIKCSAKKLLDLRLEQDNFHLNRSVNIQVLICKDLSTVKKCINFAHNHNYRVGVGSTTKNIGKSFYEAQTVIKISTLLDKDYIYYREVKFIQQLLTSDLADKTLVEKFSMLDNTESGTDLLNTLLTYLKNSGNMNKTASDLHIHRNTLLYRLSKIHNLIGLNPHKFTDLFQLFLTLLTYLNHKNPQLKIH